MHLIIYLYSFEHLVSYSLNHSLNLRTQDTIMRNQDCVGPRLRTSKDCAKAKIPEALERNLGCTQSWSLQSLWLSAIFGCASLSLNASYIYIYICMVANI